jgi:hypothetical protein
LPRSPCAPGTEIKASADACFGRLKTGGAGLGAAFASLEYHAADKRAGSFYQERMGYRPAAVTAIKRL